MMPFARIVGICMLTLFVWCLPVWTHAVPLPQAAQPPEENQHLHEHGHEMNTPSGATDKCEPRFTYEEGLRGPSHWAGVCGTGRMQTPINILKAEQVPVPPLPPLEFSYKPAALDVVVS